MTERAPPAAASPGSSTRTARRTHRTFASTAARRTASFGRTSRTRRAAAPRPVVAGERAATAPPALRPDPRSGPARATHARQGRVPGPQPTSRGRAPEARMATPATPAGAARYSTPVAAGSVRAARASAGLRANVSETCAEISLTRVPSVLFNDRPGRSTGGRCGVGVHKPLDRAPYRLHSWRSPDHCSHASPPSTSTTTSQTIG